MVDLGAFLAAFHHASTSVTPDAGDRGPTPIAALADSATWRPLDVGASGAALLDRALDDLRSGLDRIDHANLPRAVIHGDCTNHNVLASGSPARPSGIIDFSNAYCESILADLGFALWRSGRPSQQATEFDPTRIAAYLAGYASRRPLAPEDVDRVLVYLHARGLQILEKQARVASTIDAPLLTRLAWLHHHHGELHDAVIRRLLRRAK